MEPMAKAMNIIFNYVDGHLDKGGPQVFDVKVIWFSKTLQNWKAILITNLPDNKIYEVTYDGDKKCAYLDEYTKLSNTVIEDK
jgi:hypothetical protein